MDRQSFVSALRKQKHCFDVIDDGLNVTVKNKAFNTTTKFTDEAIEKYSLEELIKMTHHGKNINHITRVTGYFSVVENWNEGKKQELKDRFKSKITI